MADFIGKFHHFFSNLGRRYVEVTDDRDEESTLAEEVIARPPAKMMTDRNGAGPDARLRVDVAQTGFFAGREARSFHEFTLGNNASMIIKVVAPLDVILFEVGATITAGELQITTKLADGTEGGAFDTSLPVIPTNTMSSVPTPVYSHVVTITTGGTYSGGTVIDMLHLKTDANSNKSLSVGERTGSERGIAAGSYYYELQAGSAGATGVFSGRWEERPAGV